MTAATATARDDGRSYVVDYCLVFALSVAVQAAYVLTVPITTTLDSGPLYGSAISGAFPDGVATFLTIPFLAQITGSVFTGDLTGYLSAQSILAALMPLMLFAAIGTYSRLAAWIGTAIFIASFAPFFYSQWLMAEHVYMFGVSAVILGFVLFMQRPGWWEGAFLAATLLFATFSRSNGLLLPAVVAIAYIVHVVLTPAGRSLRSLLIVCVTLVACIGFNYGLTRAVVWANGEQISTTTPRFLFCNLYGHAVEGADGHRLTLSGEPAERLLGAIRETEAKRPEIFAEFLQRWPDDYTRFVGQPEALAQAIATNAAGGPGMNSTNHTYCWLILRTLDASYGPAEANAILMALWQDAVLRQHFGFEHYLKNTFQFFFQNPDIYYHGTTHGTGPETVPQINPYSVTPRMYAQIAYTSADSTLVDVSRAINNYWLWFMLNVTPWLSTLGVVSILGLFSRKARALVLICLGIAFYHGLINAITNVTDVRYVSSIYPALSALAGVTIAGPIGLVTRSARRR